MNLLSPLSSPATEQTSAVRLPDFPVTVNVSPEPRNGSPPKLPARNQKPSTISQTPTLPTHFALIFRSDEMIPPRNMLASLREAEPKIHTLLPPLAIFSPSSSSVFFFPTERLRLLCCTSHPRCNSVFRPRIHRQNRTGKGTEYDSRTLEVHLRNLPLIQNPKKMSFYAAYSRSDRNGDGCWLVGCFSSSPSWSSSSTTARLLLLCCLLAGRSSTHTTQIRP